MQTETDETDIAVVGAGPTGLAAALALAHAGARVALVGPPPLPRSPQRLDTRTAALLESSIDMLKALGVFDDLRPHAAPLLAIRIIDDTGGLLRAPDVEFRASELGLEAFGYNIANSALVEALYRRASAGPIALHPGNATDITFSPTHATLSGKDGFQLAAKLVVGADGRQSICRKAAGIAGSESPYGMGAIATSFAHGAPHRGVSVELHRRGGSVTTVPLVDANASSLLWLGDSGEIDALMALDGGAFQAALGERLGGLLGAVGEVAARGHFPVAVLSAASLVGPRTALVGEAAHVLPPIGAQGLNLGLREVATLADCVAGALGAGRDPGGGGVLSAYERARKPDVMTRTLGIDLLSRSLLSGFLPVQAARGLVSHGLNALPPLRRLVMRLGMAPLAELPSLMRPSAAGRSPAARVRSLRA
jgi:2-octaprenyl-6-methoxyphenol hydroxylase